MSERSDMTTPKFTIPAFPRPASEDTRNGTLADGNDVVPAQTGMTLRDYFAAKAMQAIIPIEYTQDTAKIAAWAYDYADAMIEARGEKAEGR